MKLIQAFQSMPGAIKVFFPLRNQKCLFIWSIYMKAFFLDLIQNENANLNVFFNPQLDLTL